VCDALVSGQICVALIRYYVKLFFEILAQIGFMTITVSQCNPNVYVTLRDQLTQLWKV